jgi:hypothetical protein
LAKRYEIELPFLNKDYSINQEYIQKSYEGVKEKSSYADVETKLNDLNLTDAQKAKVKDYLDGITDKITNRRPWR